MTRFARATGSKASNKREPEEATPWSTMVRQIKPVEDVEDDFDYEQGDGRMEVDTVDILAKDDDEEEEDEDTNMDNTLLDDLEENGDVTENGDVPLNSEEAPEQKTTSELVSSDEPKKKKRKKSDKCKVCGDKGHRKMDCERLPEARRKELQELFVMKTERKGAGTGRKKKKNTKEDCLVFEKDVEHNQVVKSDVVDENTAPDQKQEVLKSSPIKKTSNKTNNVKKEPAVQKVQRDKSGAVVEEGEALFQGFRVSMEDQNRLKKLVKKLKKERISKEEIDVTMKKERRIAEKSLARIKKLVCFNCREPGHMLADCPVSKSEDIQAPHQSSGHCFKCGSLEHTSKDCKSKLKRENAYRFAVCFICKEEGHLAKACPDNPKGLYPKGGGCVFCGSVEHLKRDCQRKVQKDLKQGVRVDTIAGARDLEDEPVFKESEPWRKNKNKNEKKKKIVAF